MLLALDKFKGCLTAAEACAELGKGILDAGVPVEVVLGPVADGDDGMLDAALAAGCHVIPVMAVGPLAQPRPARIGVRATTVLIELAEICGLARLSVEGRRPMEAATYGVGLGHPGGHPTRVRRSRRRARRECRDRWRDGGRP